MRSSMYCLMPIKHFDTCLTSAALLIVALNVCGFYEVLSVLSSFAIISPRMREGWLLMCGSRGGNRGSGPPCKITSSLGFYIY